MADLDYRRKELVAVVAPTKLNGAGKALTPGRRYAVLEYRRVYSQTYGFRFKIEDDDGREVWSTLYKSDRIDGLSWKAIYAKRKVDYVQARPGCMKYFTPWKYYKVLEQDDVSFRTKSDTGVECFCLFRKCPHLNNKNWIKRSEAEKESSNQ